MVSFTTSEEIYPNAAYFKKQTTSEPESPGILYISRHEANALSGILYCNIKVGDKDASSITINVRPGDRNMCDPQPCQNGATCQDDGNDGYQCICPPNFTGVHCETGIETELSILNNRNSFRILKI